MCRSECWWNPFKKKNISPFRIAQEYLEHIFFCISQETLHLFYLPTFTEYSEHKGGHLMNLMNQSIKEISYAFHDLLVNSRPNSIQPSPVVPSRYNIETYQLLYVVYF